MWTGAVENRNKAPFTHSVAKLLCFQKGTVDAVKKGFRAKATVDSGAQKLSKVYLLSKNVYLRPQMCGTWCHFQSCKLLLRVLTVGHTLHCISHQQGCLPLTAVQELPHNRNESTLTHHSATIPHDDLHWGEAAGASHDQNTFQRMLCALGIWSSTKCRTCLNCLCSWQRDNSSSRVGFIWSPLDNHLIFN